MYEYFKNSKYYDEKIMAYIYILLENLDDSVNALTHIWNEEGAISERLQAFS